VDVPAELRNVQVPSLLLQPLVENAIRHGLSHRAEGGEIAVRAEAAGDQLRILVEDDGPGLSPGGGNGREGLGLGNTRARLRQLYGDRQRLQLRNRPEGGLQVLVECPLSPIRPRQEPLA
jgi:LytS/YehU family sensor histidine kinase